MKKIIEMSDSQKENLSRWLPLIIALITSLVTLGYTFARIDTMETRINELEKDNKVLMQLPVKISNIESNTASTNAQVMKLSDELKDIFKEYKMEHK